MYPGTDFNIKNRDFAESLVERYSEGEVVEAFYDPEDPTDASLENESVATRSVIFAIILVPFVLVGLGLMVGGTLWIL